MAEVEYGNGPHAFQGTSLTASCGRCGMLRIHSNHKGYDYDATPGEHIRPELCVEGMCLCETRKDTETIADEAMRIVYGDREKAYDDPNVNFEKIAHMWNGLFLRKLRDDARITPSDVALAFVLLKVSRESHKAQRDNRVDMIGYVLCSDRIVQAAEENSSAVE